MKQKVCCIVLKYCKWAFWQLVRIIIVTTHDLNCNSPVPKEQIIWVNLLPLPIYIYIHVSRLPVHHAELWNLSFLVKFRTHFQIYVTSKLNVLLNWYYQTRVQKFKESSFSFYSSRNPLKPELWSSM